MFWKKNKKSNDVPELLELIVIEGKSYYVDQKVYNHIDKLRLENVKLKNELNAIKPILNGADYDPPVSRYCSECEYVVKSTWNGTPIGCRKNLLCESFKPKED